MQQDIKMWSKTQIGISVYGSSDSSVTGYIPDMYISKRERPSLRINPTQNY
jgi:hypothetical protein